MTAVDEIRARLAAWDAPDRDTVYFVWLPDWHQDIRYLLPIAELAAEIPDPVDYLDEDTLFCRWCDAYAKVPWSRGKPIQPLPTVVHDPACLWLRLSSALKGTQ